MAARTSYLIAAALVLSVSASCNVLDENPAGVRWDTGDAHACPEGEEIVLVLGEDCSSGTKTDSRACSSRVCDGVLDVLVTETDLDGPGTKTVAITSVNRTWYWGATTGGNSAGTSAETVKWGKASATASSGRISTGKFQTLTPTNYNYYLSNCSGMVISAGTYMTVPDNGTDFIAGRLWRSSLAAPKVSLEHVFARTGKVTFDTANDQGLTFSDFSFTLEGKGAVSGTAGTYNLRSRTWTSSSAPLGVTVLGTGASSVDTDIYLIPSVYTLTVSFRVHNGPDFLDVSRKVDVSLSNRGCRYDVKISTAMDFVWDNEKQGEWEDEWDDDKEIDL